MRIARAQTVVPGLPHHVVLRGNNRRRLCSYPSDYGHLLFLIARATERHAVALHAISVMTNHIHAIATPTTAGDLSSWVRAFAQRYAQQRNALFRASGKLFEERFFSKPIATDAQLLATVGYVDANAVLAGKAASPGAYPWCSYAHYAGRGASKVPRGSLTPLRWYDSLGPLAEVRANAYANWIAAYLGEALARREAESTPPALQRAGDPQDRAVSRSATVLRRPDRSRCA